MDDTEVTAFKGLTAEQKTKAIRLYEQLKADMGINTSADKLMLERGIRCFIEGENMENTPTVRLNNTKIFVKTIANLQKYVRDPQVEGEPKKINLINIKQTNNKPIK